ncbi:MAG TPA: rhomboid family intramembrane serine protease [Steroidobacteraceae bacterium]|jgi:membrane associated rhomboid family serine protease|nr:rhomboid family intramembrane serine protease [Steroidobacteraceae bacterium]
MAAWVILGLTVIISLVGLAWPPLIAVSLFRPYWWLRKRQYWTPLSNGFVHASIGHLLLNCLSYWFFAFRLQRVIGDARFIALYVVGLIASNSGTYFKHRAEPEYACLGSSGAVLAVLFAGIIYFPHSSLLILPIPIPIPAPLFGLLYLGYSFYASRHPIGRVNHEAHFDGALAGLAFVALTDWPVWQHTLRGWM